MIFRIDVGGKTFNVPRVSARDQMKAWGVITKYVSPKAIGGKDLEINAEFFIGVYLMAGDEVVMKMADLLLPQAKLHGSSDKLEIEDFQDDFFDYVILTAEASAKNLKGFTSYLENLNSLISQEIKEKENQKKISLTGSS